VELFTGCLSVGWGTVGTVPLGFNSVVETGIFGLLFHDEEVDHYTMYATGIRNS